MKLLFAAGAPVNGIVPDTLALSGQAADISEQSLKVHEQAEAKLKAYLKAIGVTTEAEGDDDDDDDDEKTATGVREPPLTPEDQKQFATLCAQVATKKFSALKALTEVEVLQRKCPAHQGIAILHALTASRHRIDIVRGGDKKAAAELLNGATKPGKLLENESKEKCLAVHEVALNEIPLASAIGRNQVATVKFLLFECKALVNICGRMLLMASFVLICQSWWQSARLHCGQERWSDGVASYPPSWPRLEGPALCASLDVAARQPLRRSVGSVSHAVGDGI